MREYKWPAKIRRYKIMCPCQRLLIAKYEAVVDWNGDRIESPEALDEHICRKMLPELKKRIDPSAGESHYCREINLLHMLQNPAPHIGQTRDVLKRQGWQAARTFLLNHINRHKQESFEGWWNYLTAGNPVYAKHPAFQYLMLRPVIDSSDAKSTRSPVQPDAEAVAYVFEGIMEGRISPVGKLLRTACEYMAFGRRNGNGQLPFDTACGWVRINGNMANTVTRLAALAQGSGWCVATPLMAARYLESSEFHVLVENGRAVSAVRMAEGKAVEIQGNGNKDPGPWWPRILLYCAARGAPISCRRGRDVSAVAARCREELAGKTAFRELASHLAEHPAEVQFVAQDVMNDESFRPVIEGAWLACAKADPGSAALVPSWMARDANLAGVLVEGWRNVLILDPRNIVGMPESLQRRKEFAAERILCWGLAILDDARMVDECPPDVRCDPELMTIVRKAWVRLLRRVPSKWEQCPAYLHGDGQVFKALRRAFADRLERDLTIWASRPPCLGDEAQFAKALKAGWIREIRKAPRAWVNCPPALKHDVDVIAALKDACVNYLRRAGRRDMWWGFWDILSGDATILDRATECLCREPVLFDDCPDALRTHADVAAAVKRACLDRVAHDSSCYCGCPAAIRADPDIQAACVKSMILQLKSNPESVCRIPREILAFDVASLHEAIACAKVERLRALPRALYELGASGFVWGFCAGPDVI
jgi:hypothetical protein